NFWPAGESHGLDVYGRDECFGEAPAEGEDPAEPARFAEMDDVNERWQDGVGRQLPGGDYKCGGVERSGELAQASSDPEPIAAGVIPSLGKGAEPEMDHGQLGGVNDMPPPQQDPEFHVPVVSGLELTPRAHERVQAPHSQDCVPAKGHSRTDSVAVA